MDNGKRDLIYDTKGGRIFMHIMATLLIGAGGFLIVLAVSHNVWNWWILLGVCGIVTGICNVIVCNRKRKESSK